MVRFATAEDAEQLEMLNREFNGPGEAGPDHIRRSLLENRQEAVVVDEENGRLTGFACIQWKRSFCYSRPSPEITELYVRREFRRRGIARKLLSFAEALCRGEGCSHLELLTGEDNFAARALYQSLGYAPDGEIHLSKPAEK